MARPHSLPETPTTLLLKAWPDTAAIAADLDLSYYTVAAWLRRDSVPVAYWDALVRSARKRGLRGVSLTKFRAASVDKPSKTTKRPPIAIVKDESSDPVVLQDRSLKEPGGNVQGGQNGIVRNISPPPKNIRPIPSERTPMTLDHAAGSNTASNDLCADYMRRYRQQKRKCDEETGVLRALLKKAKSDGMNTRAMIEAVKATKLEPEVVAADLRDQIRYMGIIHLPMTQAALFEGYDFEVNQKTRQEDDLWDAGDKGYRAGRQGAKIEDCPYINGSEFFAQWVADWHKGQAAIARELGSAAKMASTSKERPERAQSQMDVSDETNHPPPYVPGAKAKRGRAAKARGSSRRGADNGAGAAVN